MARYIAVPNALPPVHCATTRRMWKCTRDEHHLVLRVNEVCESPQLLQLVLVFVEL